MNKFIYDPDTDFQVFILGSGDRVLVSTEDFDNLRKISLAIVK